jgi:hypothetical protein
VTVVVHVVSRTRTALGFAGVVACLGGLSVACVDTGPRIKPGAGAGGGSAPTLTCEVPAPAPYAGSATIPSDDPSAGDAYVWKNAVIKGGGFVSGIITSPALSGLVFARTDVGGAYRYDPANRRWRAITDWAGHNDSNLTGIESIAPDPIDPNRVYIAAGQYLTAGNGSILSSTDMGQTWTRNSIGAPMGGNADGRSMGERLAVDPNLPSTLYFGSRTTGLWKSTDSAQTWTLVTDFPTLANTNGGTGTGYGLTFVVFDRSSGSPGSPTPVIYVGAGVTAAAGLYRSTDAGATWQEVAAQPTGVMPHHAVLDGCGNLYLTYNNGPGPNNVSMGAVWRYAASTGDWTDVSPLHLGGGFGGLSADVAHPGTLLVTTIDYWSPGEIFRTTDGGKTWVRLVGASQRDVAGASWLYWHTANLPAMGWMGDVEIDPFNPSRALYVTGQGLWSSDDITAADSGAATHWSFDDDGLEETVALDIASPPSPTGAIVLSGVGDIAGFRHDDLATSPPSGMFANPIFGNTASLDFAEGAPDIVARVGTASSGGGRGAYSLNGGTTWTGFLTYPAATGTTVPASGSIAVSADGTTFVWAPQSGTPSYSVDHGAHWTASTGITAGARVAADRVNASKFYASRGTRMYLSTDGGATFVAATASPSGGRPRPVFGVEGDIWVTTGNSLLRSQDSGATYAPVPLVGGASAVGFGMAATGQSYPAVYVAATIGGVWGTYRADNVGEHPDGVGVIWQRIDDPQHQFGIINCLAGDPRRYGRIYLGTAGRGIVYGDPQPQQ